jgi:hypothetical protein
MSCLEQVRDRWDAGHRPLALAPLEAWFEVSGRLLDPPRPPAMAPTWIELLPGPDIADPVEATRAADWLGLTELLARHAPEKLRALGFPESQRERLKALVDEAARKLLVSEERAPLLAIIERTARLVPELAGNAASLVPPPPEMLAPPPPLEFSDTVADVGEHMLVDRVLRDL